jgi:hypothetical protein
VETSASSKRYQILGIIAASLCFLIGFWHTGKGLAQFNILDLKWGSFIVAAMLLIFLVMAYAKAVAGSQAGLWIYLFFALVTFVCNVNSFYPNYRGDALVRDELKEHQQALNDLRDNTDTAYRSEKREKFIQMVESQTQQVEDQIKREGYGPLTRKAVGQLESLLSINPGSITPLNRGRTQEEWNSDAVATAGYFRAALKANLEGDKYAGKRDLVRDTRQLPETYIADIGKVLKDRAALKSPPQPLVDNIVRDYQEACGRAHSFAKPDQPFNCDRAYNSQNKEIGTFSHTFSSTWKTLSDGGTLWVLIIALFLDFICPLAIYILVKRRRSSGWNADKYLKPATV